MAYLPFSPVMGRLNPASFGIEIRRVGDKVVSEVELAEPAEGATGLVHGGVIAAIYDEVLAAANLMIKAGGPTGNAHGPLPQADAPLRAPALRGLGRPARRPQGPRPRPLPARRRARHGGAGDLRALRAGPTALGLDAAGHRAGKRVSRFPADARRTGPRSVD
jgi:hypothetical protein